MGAKAASASWCCLVLMVVVFAGGGCGGSSGTVRSGGSGSLDGLSVDGNFDLVKSPVGVAVISGDRNGHPAVFLPLTMGWMTADHFPALEEAIAWFDGGVIQVAGHVCSTQVDASEQSTTREPKSMESLVHECPRDPIETLTFNLADHTWSKGFDKIDPHGAWIDPIRGYGKSIFASRSTELPTSGMAVIDVKGGPMTTVPSSQTPPSVVPCLIGGHYVVAARGTWLSKGSDGGVTGASGPDLGPVQPLKFQRVPAQGISDAKVDWSGLPKNMVQMRVGGCVQDVFVVDLLTTAKAKPVGAIVRLGKDNKSLVAQRLPDPGLGGGDVLYGTDRTGTKVIVTKRRAAATANGRTATVKTWDPTAAKWVLVTDELPVGAQVAAQTNGGFLQITKTGATSTFNAIQ